MVAKQINAIELSQLERSEKWLINHFLSQNSNVAASALKVLKLSDLVTERNETIDPQRYPIWDFAYIGLENLESNTGLLINCCPKPGKEIKSRTKIFYGGDLLFGKLRPSLNKVHLVDKNFGAGVCSTEIFVLKVDETAIKPSILRFLLSTEYVLSQVSSFTAGAALPRIHIKDFMNISIPLINEELVDQLNVEVEAKQSEIRYARERCLTTKQSNEYIFKSYFSEYSNSNAFLFDSENSSQTFVAKLPI